MMNIQNAFSQGQVPDAKLAIPLTVHAAIRAKQRGVNRSVLDCLLLYGRHEHDHMGCEVVTFDDETLDEVARLESRDLWRKVAEARSVYAIVDSEGSVVTTGHRFRKVLRDRSLSSNRPGRSRRPRKLHGSPNRQRFS